MVPSPQAGQMLCGVSVSSKELMGLRSPPYSSLLVLLAGASNAARAWGLTSVSRFVSWPFLHRIHSGTVSIPAHTSLADNLLSGG